MLATFIMACSSFLLKDLTQSHYPTSLERKPCIFNFYRTEVIPDVKNATLRPLVKQHVEKGSTIYTDSWKGYKGLKKDGFIHKLVDRDGHLVSDNKDHTNNIGGYWRLSKHKMFARYHKTSKKHLKDYLAEADFKFNQRHNKDFIRSVLIKLLLVP